MRSHLSIPPGFVASHLPQAYIDAPMGFRRLYLVAARLLNGRQTFQSPFKGSR